MRAFWVDTGKEHISAIAIGILAIVKSKPGLYGADWKLWVHGKFVESGKSGTVRGAKTQATCAAKEWIFDLDRKG